MSGNQQTRRTFIKTAGATGVSVYVLWSGPGIGSWFGPRMVLAANLSVLTATEGKETLAMARQLFPHDTLGDEFYWVVVESIDRDMAGSPELASRVRDGLAKLEGTPFFSDMLNKTQFYFYNNKAVWSKFGYEGSSWEKGGYINRGFNDVEWTQG
jgi:hypothetical protein